MTELRDRLAAASDDLLIRDAARLSRQLRHARGGRFDVPRFLADLERARRAAQTRAASRPSLIEYPAELPVAQAREELMRAIREHQIVIVCGETGSGKTTQLPKLCLDLGRGARGLIGHTQPRRLAARSVAARIAQELKTSVGALVGCETRFDRRVSSQTLIKLMTDGILLAELQRDRELLAYDTLIVDEAHERSLNIDVLLGWLRVLARKRPELKIIITSATLNPEKLAAHFSAPGAPPVPILTVSGRTYPVELRYRPPEADDDLEDAVGKGIEELWNDSRPGDTLVFLPGEREIHDLARSLPGRFPRAQILTLYSRLPAEAQDRVFAKGGAPRIVLTTNVAETSVTVPGIRYVVDVGTARINRWSVRLGIQQLQIEAISQASANQRAGRCGRVGPGICLRLYDEADLEARAAFTDPEILRSNLAGVILQLAALGLGDVEAFAWIDAPDARHISSGYRLLQTLGALDENRALTKMGGELARLPLDPRVGRIALAARGSICADEVFVLAAALSVQDPHETPPDAIDAARQKHALWRHPRSDFLSLLNLWRLWRQWSAQAGNREVRKLCREHYVSFLRMEEWEAVYRQIEDFLEIKRADAAPVPVDELYAPLHQALLAGLIDHIGLKVPEAPDFQGPRGRRFRVFPGSGLAKKPPRWLMCAHLVHTSQVFARRCAAIEPDWLGVVAPHLVKHTLLAPEWSPQRGEVSCTEHSHIFGLPIGSRLRHYGSIHPAEARDIFIREALVGGDLPNKPSFLRHNLDLVGQIRDKETRLRRPDLLADADRIFAWYAQRIPQEICTAAALKKWQQAARASLRMREADLLRPGADADLKAWFPDVLQVGTHRLRLSYAHEPGQDEDGVSFHIPLAVLFDLPAERFDWLVPGLLAARIEGLIRSLPHKLRRYCTPAAEYARALAARMSPDESALLPAICAHFHAMTGVQLAPGDFEPDKLDAHLRPRLLLENESAEPLAAEESLTVLQTRFRTRVRELLNRTAAQTPALASLVREHVHSFDFGDLPDRLELPGGAPAYPALHVNAPRRVGLCLFESRAAAQLAHRQGLELLLLGKFSDRVRELTRTAKSRLNLALVRTPHRAEALARSCAARAIRSTWATEGLRTQAACADAVQRSGEFGRNAARLLDEVCDWLIAAFELRRRLHALQERWPDPVADVNAQLQSLLAEDFVLKIPDAQWPRIAVYLRAIAVRLDRLPNKPARDLESTRVAQGLMQRLPEGFHPARWLIEEWRVAQFAQELRATGVPTTRTVEAALPA